MPELHDPEEERGKKRRFINEKVVKRPPTRKQMIKRGAMLCCGALLCGVIAGIGFAVSEPLAEQYLLKETEPESTISIPKDEPLEPLEQAEETQAEIQSEPIEEVVQSAMERYRYTVDDLNSMLNSLRSQVLKVNKGIVVVHSVQQEMDWFDNPVETTGFYAGAVIAKTPQELLILTPEAAVEQADSIKVTFHDGQEVDGRMKQRDHTSGMAIVSVSAGDMTSDMLQDAEILTLGNSYVVKEGDLVIAVGSPAGKVYSIDYGYISYIQKNVEMVDRIGPVLYAGISADEEKGTFLVNTSGELIGWVIESEETPGRQIVEVLGISGYKGILEKLTNGQEAPCFGIIGQSVTESMEQNGLPKGIYVMNSVTDGPAYNAGIQNGDVITMIGEKEMTSMKDFQSLVDSLQSGAVLDVVVQRNGREQFTQLQFQVQIGAR